MVFFPLLLLWCLKGIKVTFWGKIVGSFFLFNLACGGGGVFVGKGAKKQKFCR